MEKQSNMFVRNFFALNDFSKSSNGNYKVSGLLSTFDNAESNFNGYVYKAGCYNDFCQNYYGKNGKNIPLDVLHNVTDLSHLVGKVTEFTATNSEARIVAEVSRYALHFENIVGLIEDGILQGFSDMSFVNDAKYLDNGLLEVLSCSLFSVALVQNPAVVASSLVAANATKFNFETKTENETKPKNTLFGL